MLIPSDQQLLATLTLALLAAGVVVWWILKKLDFDPALLMTPAEWRAAAKIIGIVVLGFLLYQASVALEFPAESFIYGRF